MPMPPEDSARAVLGTRVVTTSLPGEVSAMPEEELNSCSRLHVTGCRKPLSSQPGSKSTVPQCPPEPLRVPICALQALWGQWRSAARTGALLGPEIMFSACGCAADAPASHRKLSCSPGTPLSVAHARTRAHAHRVNRIFLIISANHLPSCSDRRSRLVSAQRNDKPVSSPSQRPPAHHPASSPQPPAPAPSKPSRPSSKMSPG